MSLPLPGSQVPRRVIHQGTLCCCDSLSTVQGNGKVTHASPRSVRTRASHSLVTGSKWTNGFRTPNNAIRDF